MCRPHPLRFSGLQHLEIACYFQNQVPFGVRLKTILHQLTFSTLESQVTYLFLPDVCDDVLPGVVPSLNSRLILPRIVRHRSNRHSAEDAVWPFEVRKQVGQSSADESEMSEFSMRGDARCQMLRSRCDDFRTLIRSVVHWCCPGWRFLDWRSHVVPGRDQTHCVPVSQSDDELNTLHCELLRDRQLTADVPDRRCYCAPDLKAANCVQHLVVFAAGHVHDQNCHCPQNPMLLRNRILRLPRQESTSRSVFQYFATSDVRPDRREQSTSPSNPLGQNDRYDARRFLLRSAYRE